MDFDLALGGPGAELADLSPRLYYGGVPVALGAGVALTAVNGVDYVLSGLPDTGPYQLTYEFPAGVWGVLRWGVGAPREIVVPIREAGLNAADLSLALSVNGSPSAVPLTAQEVGAPGDYRVSGWPAPLPGERWTLRWGYGGVYGSETWRNVAAAGGTRLDLPDRALAAFTVLWRAQVPPAGRPAMPHVVGMGGGWNPANQEPYVELDVLMDKGEEWGPVGTKNYEMVGLLQASVHVKVGSGTVLMQALLGLVGVCIQGMAVTGLRVYGCRMPYELPSPPDGYYSRAVDAPARYLGP